MTAMGPVLVTGADQHQGLAVIRGLGQAGIPVIAAGTERRSLGFASRYATVTHRYASPFSDPARATNDLLAIIEATRPAVVIPSVEATLVLLNEARARVEQLTVLAAPSSEVLEQALDKGRTLELARRCGVPAPRTARGGSVAALLAEAVDFQFPVVVKPRGNALHASTANALGFKVRYAPSLPALRTMLEPFANDGKALLLQEYSPGVGRCVAAVCDHGRPLALFAYARDREVPLTGGVSVLRSSIPLDPLLERHTRTLLAELQWHGIAMVEFKYDAGEERYTLMEINGRFQASTALSLDAGLNLPHLVAALYAGWPLPEVRPYRIGVRERWLRGDLLALAGVWRGNGDHPPVAVRGRLGATWDFLRDFHPGMYYDEFKWADWRPGLVELRDLVIGALRWTQERLVNGWRRLSTPAAAAAAPSVTTAANRVASTSTHRSIRA